MKETLGGCSNSCILKKQEAVLEHPGRHSDNLFDSEADA